MNGRSIFILILFFTSQLILGQTHLKVIDAHTRLPLVGSVIQLDSLFAGITNQHGEITINEKPESILIISFLGYKSDTIQITSGISLVELESNSIELGEVMITSSCFHEKSKKTTQSISMLTMIELGSHTNINQQINKLAGVYNHKGSLTTYRTTIRGIGSRSPYSTNRIKAYLNDISLTTGDGTTIFEDIDPMFIDRVEVVKGPRSALYGAGLGGSLNIYNHYPSAYSKPIKIDVGIGEYNTSNARIKGSFYKPKIAGSAIFSRVYSEGYRENSTYERYATGFLGRYSRTNSETGMMIYSVYVNGHIPSSLTKEMYASSPEKAAPNWLNVEGYEKYSKIIVGVTNRYIISSSLENRISIYSGFNDGYEVRPFNILDDQGFSIGFKEQIHIGNSTIKLISSGELFIEQYKWEILNNQEILLNKNNELRKHLNTSVNLIAFQDRRFTLQAGANVSFIDYQLTDMFSDTLDNSGTYKYLPVFSPMAGINFEMYKGIHLYASVGHGFSVPSVEETLLPEGNFNAELKYENGTQLDIGSRLYLFNRKMFFDISAYYIDCKDLLVTKRVTEDDFLTINAGRVSYSGFELSGYWDVFSSNNDIYSLRFEFTSTISENLFLKFIDDTIDYSDQTLPGIPEYMITTGFKIRVLRDIVLDFDIQTTGLQYLDDANSLSYPGYQLLNGKLSYSYGKVQNINVNVYLNCSNILDRKYASMILVNAPSFGNINPRYYYPGQPRFFYCGMLIEF